MSGRERKSLSLTYFEFVRAPTNMDEEWSVKCQQGMWPVQKFRFPHCSDPFTNLIFDIAGDLIKFLDFF